MARTLGLGGGLAATGVQQGQQAMEMLGNVAQQEQQRELANEQMEQQRKAGNQQLGAMGGAMAGMAVAGPYGAIAGGLIGAVAGGLF